VGFIKGKGIDHLDFVGAGARVAEAVRDRGGNSQPVRADQEWRQRSGDLCGNELA
jgi:hypothetical protein